jgi:uncharacterized membrane protein YgdD (TMEM256/DUF423 family)
MIRPPLVLAALAALMGCAGVTLAAAAVHESGGELATRGALFLILHATAALGIAAHARIAPSRALLIVGFIMEAGATLFAADLANHAFAGQRLFPFAAPIGGSAMILSWLALAAAFAFEAWRNDFGGKIENGGAKAPTVRLEPLRRGNPVVRGS